MMIGKMAVSAAVLVFVTWESSAIACSPAYRKTPTPEEIQQSARLLVEHASAVIDGEVIRVQTEGRPAQVRVHRLFKGPNEPILEIAAGSTCDSWPGALGERGRYVLFGGPDIYRIHEFAESIFTVDREIKLAPYVDKELGSVRENEWPHKLGKQTRP
jgi:hypothetical protein